MASATTGSTALENIPLNQIERIEVVPGQLSSLYGSDAIGGVVQIFTKSGKYSSGANVTAGLGSYGTYATSAGINRTVGATEFSVNLGYFDTAGFDAIKPSSAFHNPDKDGYKNSNFSGKITQHLDPDNEVGLTAFYSDGLTHFDATPTTDDINHQTLSAYSLYSRNRIGVWESVLRLGQSTDGISTSGAFPGFVRTRQPQITWQNNFKVNSGTAIAGLEYLEQHVAGDPPFTPDFRRIGSAFAGYLGEFGMHAWQINLRQDDNSQFGSHTTGLLGYAIRANSNLRFRVGAGTAFRAPTFNDLYSPFGGNPDLQPERAVNLELGVNYQSANTRFSATYFNNRITDLIVLDPTTFIPQNVGQASVDGIELGYEAIFGGFRVSANLTLQDPVDEATGLLLQRRAKEFGSLTVSKTYGPLTIGTQAVASSARFDKPGEAEGSRMHGYGLVNLTAVYALGREWSIRARWNNVFDREYELAQNFNTPGSNVFVALQYQPK
jgi:vitamin B12 transporter